MSLFALEEKIGQGIMGHRARQLQGVAEVSAKIGFHGPGPVVVVVRRSCNLLRELRNTTVKLRQLQVAGNYVGG